MVRVAVVTPEKSPPLERLTLFLRHWYVRLVPAALTEKVVELPAQTVFDAGWPPIEGGMLYVIITSLADVQAPLLIVHRSVTVPATDAVAFAPGEVASSNVITGVPVTLDHEPVPTEGEFPARVATKPQTV
jgi:hypothetical protein